MTQLILAMTKNFSGVMRVARGVGLLCLISILFAGVAHADGTVVCMASTTPLSATQYALADCGIPPGSSAMVELTGHNSLTMTTFITLTEQSQHCLAPVPVGFSNLCAVQVNDGFLDVAESPVGYEVRVTYTYLPRVVTETLSNGMVITTIIPYPENSLVSNYSTTAGDGNIINSLLGLMAIQVVWYIFIFFNSKGRF